MYSSNGALGGRPLRGRGSAAPHPTLRGGVFSLFLGLALIAGDASAAMPPVEPVPENDLLLRLQDIPPAPSSADSAESAETVAARVQSYLQQARTSGDPRFLGYAQSALQQWPEDTLTPRLRVLRGSLRQSLHKFVAAEEDLKAVTESDAPAQLRSQAQLILASMALAQGHYEEARTACQALAEEYAGLIAASCSAQVDARTGQAQSAYEKLKPLTEGARAQRDPVGLAWAQGTLADIAAQLGKPEAERYWQAILARNPDDLYTRTQYSDWLIQHDRAQDALALTEGYEQVDSLAVLRAVILATQGKSDSPLIEMLGERFDEAQWRGDLLHKRELARFLLDVEDQPETAFDYAWSNWQTQREPADTRLVLRAARAADKADAIEEVSQWLKQHQQHDQRYPEATL
ncbi:tetratricopeptide repeat protein [Marinobacter fonticola]|uniref:tetratricopeptide repeat protein n=1 Tax=Marinobacter fonticola TaxID=2603215 RepID=UPI001D0D91B8|nr:hypothetical protein [Marinobacter fonticola]